ncbi:hypothetical protein ACFYN9_36660 [Streptomyces collinus]
MGLRLTSGRPEVAVPPSGLPPTDVELPDRAIGVEPGETCRPVLTDH